MMESRLLNLQLKEYTAKMHELIGALKSKVIET